MIVAGMSLLPIAFAAAGFAVTVELTLVPFVPPLGKAGGMKGVNELSYFGPEEGLFAFKLDNIFG